MKEFAVGVGDDNSSLGILLYWLGFMLSTYACNVTYWHGLPATGLAMMHISLLFYVLAFVVGEAEIDISVEVTES